MGTGQIAAEIKLNRERSVSLRVKPYYIKAVIAAAFTVLAGRLFVLCAQYQVNIFFWDEWDIKNATLFEKHSVWQMFAFQQNWHRLGVGAWLETLVDPLFRWNSRAEAFLLTTVLAAAAISALWLKKRLGGSLSVSDVAIPAIFFTPAQWEVLYGTPDFSHGPVPLLLTMFYCIAWTINKSWLRYALVLLINFLTIYTGFGVFLGVLTPALLVLDHFSTQPQERLNKSYFALALLLSIASIGSASLGYRQVLAVRCSPTQGHSPHFYVVFMALIWAHFFGLDSTGFWPRLLGKTFLIVLATSAAAAVVFLLRGKFANILSTQRKIRIVATALMSLSLLSCAATAYGRLCGGMPSALAPRYAVYVQMGLLGFYFHLLTVRSDRIRKWLIAALTMAVLIAAVHVDRVGMAHFRDIKQRWRTCYLETEDITRCDQVAGSPMHPRRQQTRLDEKLRFLKERRLNLYLDSR